MSKITNDGLTRSGTGCFIAVPIWQRWASKGRLALCRPMLADRCRVSCLAWSVCMWRCDVLIASDIYPPNWLHISLRSYTSCCRLGADTIQWVSGSEYRSVGDVKRWLVLLIPGDSTDLIVVAVPVILDWILSPFHGMDSDWISGFLSVSVYSSLMKFYFLEYVPYRLIIVATNQFQ